MATVKTPEQAKVLLSEVRGKSKTVLFGEEISKMKSTEALHITTTEWPMKTTPAAYYYRVFKGKDKAISINKVKDGYLLVKA